MQVRLDVLEQEFRAKAGLTDFRFSLGEDGSLTFDPHMSEGQRRLVEQVVSAHTPTQVPPAKVRVDTVRDLFSAIEALPSGPIQDVFRQFKGLL